MILQRQQGRDPDRCKAHQCANGGRGEALQIMRQDIGYNRQDHTAGCSNDRIVAPVGLGREQDRDHIKNRDRSLERGQHVNQKNRDGEDGGPQPQTNVAHG
ncbi:hypothetical protein [Bradyrhizobium sp. 5.13L]